MVVELGHWCGEGVGSCMRMIWSMCRMGLQNRGSSEELKDVSEITELCLSLGVRWFSRVEERGRGNPISGCGLIECDIVQGAGRPCGA